jgi:RHS repeat-associated protein
MLYAANRDAIVRRGYNPNGSISGDTLIIATYATRDTTQHVYGLRYAYDMAGRRTALVHPGTLAPAGGWTVHNNYDPTTGALASVQDPAGIHQFAYNIAGQKTGELYPNSVQELYNYDAEGRLRTRRLTIPGMGVLDDDTLSYDARGKLANVNQRIGEVINFYSGLGSLAWSRSSPDGTNYMEQGYVQDALGNTGATHKYDYTKVDIPKLQVTGFTYDSAGTGRLWTQAGSAGGGGVTTSGSKWTYDPAGNTVFSGDSRVYEGIPNSRREEGKASYYDASGRLRIVDMQACAWRQDADTGAMICNSLREGDRSAFEEYRYDPLGRRVLVRSAEQCEVACIEKVTRTVWDGDRILWEIRTGGDNPERDVVPAGQLPPYHVDAGRVAYTFGEALDHPLAVHRFDYRDSVFSKYDTGPAPIGMQPLTIYPHTNWRGDYQIGTFSTGETQRCVQAPGQPGDNETVDGYVPGGPGTINPTYPYCLAAVRWAGNYVWLDHSVRKAPPGTDGFWVGSLVHNKRDLTGNLYMRNRYYDATAGRFTQEDPIGLAGGLNAYGFANGNPVSYSDPYGLWADTVKVTHWEATGSGGSSLGHISISFDGRTYSFGRADGEKWVRNVRGHLAVESTQHYFDRNGFRSATSYILDVTPSQEIELEKRVANFDDQNSTYDILTRNCADLVQSSLESMGFDLPGWGSVTPSDLVFQLQWSGLVKGTQEHEQLRPSGWRQAPWTWGK